jgi:signal transduction histidine kinase
MQIRYFTLAAVIGFFGGANNWPLWYDLNFPPYANILISVYIGIVAYAIVKHQLMDIKIIIKKTLVFAGLFVASYAVIASFAYLGSTVFENVIHNRWITMVSSVLIIVVMLRPLENFLRNATDKFLFQKKYDYKKLIKTFSDEVITVLDLNELVNLTVNNLADIMKLENATILLRDDEMREFHMVASAGGNGLSGYLPEEDQLITYMQRKGGYILLNDDRGKNSYEEGVEKRFKSLGAILVIPLAHQKNTFGILTMGKKKSDEEFTQDDIDIILPLARTLSIAITNAQLFEKLSEAQAQAAQREKMAVIGTLSAGINHEICNPLGIARGQCEMFLLNLKEGIYDDRPPEELLEKARGIMEKVINETDRATVITKKLSSFAKPSNGVITNNVNVVSELDEVISLVEHDLKLDNISIKKDVEEGLPHIAADKKQVQEIFFNLIRNAAQSIVEKGEIHIRATSINDKVYIEIQDTGIGMDKNQLAQIFDPFFTTKEPGEGTGLGLFIVKQIVEKNGGKIAVKSELGAGTIFYLRFNAVTF